MNQVVEKKIRARVLDALAAGWTPEELWEERFWNIDPVTHRNCPGLAACMKPEEEIGEITPDYIELCREKPGGERIILRFYKQGGQNGPVNP